MEAIDDPDALCRPYLQRFAIDGVAISTLGSTFGGETVAASDTTAARLDEIQLDLGEGPCWDAIHQRAPILVADTRTDARWPIFNVALESIDVRTIYAAPLTYAGLTVGVIDLYARQPRRLTTTDRSKIDAVTASTALQVLLAVLGENGDEESTNLNSRRVVHQATGMIIARDRVTAEDALLLLRAHAFTQNRTVVDVATDIITRRTGYPDSPARQ